MPRLRHRDLREISLWDAELFKCYGNVTIAVEPSGGLPEVVRWKGMTFITNDKLWGSANVPYFEASFREIGVHDLVQS